MAHDRRLLSRHQELLAERHNLTAAVPPVVTDDETDFYSPGSVWINTATNAVYICADATTGAAVWTSIGGVTAYEAAIDPTANDDLAAGYPVGSLWINTTTKSFFVSVDSSAGAAIWNELPHNNLIAVTAPGAGDDVDDGYNVGSVWIDTATNIIYQCVDATAAAAIWIRIAASAESAAAPTVGDDIGDGYNVGSTWTDTTLNERWVCVDNSAGAAIWVRVTTCNNAAADPGVNDDIGDGYVKGSTWVNTTNGTAWVCINNTLAGAAWLQVTKNNSTNSDPTVNDDIDQGYVPGCVWVNTTNDTAWICVDNTNGAADWMQIVKTNAAGSDPGVNDDIDSGYIRGSLWINTGTNGVHICVDNTNGAAVWRPMPYLDFIGSTRGSILHRTAAGWATLTPGTANYVIRSGGAGADLAYASLASLITALDNNVTQADGKYIATDKIRARNGDGLNLQDDDGNGIFVKDGGNVGIGTTAPNAAICVRGGMACGGYTLGTGYRQGNLGGADITFLKNTAMLLVGWNRSGGRRETAFITNPRGATGGSPGGFCFIMYEDDGTETELVTIQKRAGNVWIAGECSAQTFIDRCKFPTGIDALAAIRPIKGDGKGELDHASLPDCVRVRAPKDIFEEQDVLDEDGKPKLDPETGQKITERIKVGEEIEEGRDLGAMVSVLTKAVQELEAIVKAQAVEIAALKKVAGGRT